MTKKESKLSWCKVRLGQDFNWWVVETSDKVNWDVDGLSVIDPRQAAHILDTVSGLKEYGFQDSLLEKAFFTFAIDKKDEKNLLKISKVAGSVFDDEQYFWLPNNLDDESSPYAEFLDHITSLQVKMLNDNLHFEEKLTIEELEDEIREKYHVDYMEGKAIHTFCEVMDIVDYVPEGYSLDSDEDEFEKDKGEEEYDDIDSLPDEEEESIEEDDTMQWDEEDDMKDDYDDYKGDGDDFGNDDYYKE